MKNNNETIIKKKINYSIFHEYDSDLVFNKCIEDFHNMAKTHTEILGQFLDFTAMNVEQLKECLISGYIHMDRNKFINQ